MFKAVEAITPAKDAAAYWQSVNRALLEFSAAISPLWQTEKEASLEAIAVEKDEALEYLAGERRKILLMSKEDAIRELIRERKLDSKIAAIEAVQDTGILDFK